MLLSDYLDIGESLEKIGVFDPMLDKETDPLTKFDYLEYYLSEGREKPTYKRKEERNENSLTYYGSRNRQPIWNRNQTVRTSG